jgi:cytochrome c oxidase subunit 3
MTPALKLREPYAEPAQQYEADMLGMYLFLATEIMLFGGLFAALAAYRVLHPHEFAAASRKLHLWIATANTVVLLTSSLLVALAVRAARLAEERPTVLSLVGAAALGAVFLGLKGLEYWEEFWEGILPVPGSGFAFASPFEHIFMNIYLIATGLHAVHLTIGILLLLGLAYRIEVRSLRLPERLIAIELPGLYWHLVDVIWVFLLPALYLAR